MRLSAKKRPVLIQSFGVFNQVKWKENTHELFNLCKIRNKTKNMFDYNLLLICNNLFLNELQFMILLLFLLFNVLGNTVEKVKYYREMTYVQLKLESRFL